MNLIRAVLWLSVLIPLSVDNRWTIHWSFYDIRLSYLTFALAFLFELGIWLRQAKQSGKLFSIEAWVSAWTLCPQQTISILCFLFVGFIGIFVSLNPNRSFFFTLWVAGTLLGTSLYFARIGTSNIGIATAEGADQKRIALPRLMVISILIYGAGQSVIALLDSVLCFFSGPSSTLGRVMIYSFATQTPLCRPHVFYQEPGYFSGFLLYCLLIQKLWRVVDQDFIRQKRMTKNCMGLGLLYTAAILVSTSRMGILGAFCFWLIEGISAISKMREFGSIKKMIVYTVSMTRHQMIALFAAIFMAGGMFALNWKIIDAYLIHSERGILSDGSFGFRFQKLKHAFLIFLESPLLGVGPGGAGAYFIEKMPEQHYWWGKLMPADTLDYEYKMVSNDPFSLNLYTEILSEWGVLGAVSLASVFLLLLIRLPSRTLRAQCIGVLLILYSATQTIQRFDLWICFFALLLMVSGGVFPPAKIRRIKGK